MYVGISTVISSFPQYDDAFNASVAKNLATGFGYSASFHTKRLFPAEVSTGPSLILPGALFIYIFGTRYWVPSFTTFIICTILFMYIIKLLLEYISKYPYHSDNFKFSNSIFTLSILLFSLFLVPEIRSISFIGEFPAALFVCAGALSIFKRKVTKTDVFIGGCLLGLSITSKVIALGLVLPVLLFWILYHLIYDKDKEIFPKLILLILGVVLPSLLFEIFKLFTIGWNDYLILKQKEFEFFSNYGSGITQTLNSSDLFNFIKTNIANNLKVLYSTLHARIILIIFIIFNFVSFIIMVRKLFQKRNISSLEIISLVSLFTAVPLTIWWLGFNHIGWYRTISPVTTVAVLSIVININILFKKPIFAGIVFLSILIILFSSIHLWRYFSPPLIPRDLIKATNSTVKYLDSLQAEGKELLGCAWWANRRLEYFMQSNQNFYECLVSPLEDSVLVIDSEFWNWGYREDVLAVEEQCTTLIFEEYPYKIYKCAE